MKSNFKIDKECYVCLSGANGDLGRQLVTDFYPYDCDFIFVVRFFDQQFADFLDGFKDLRFKVYECDLADEIAVTNTAKLIVSENKKIDIFINNAAVAHGSLFQMQSQKELHKIFQVNFFSPFILTQYISRRMKKNLKGSIVNIASSAAIDANEGRLAYVTSKASIMSASKVLARELALYNIRSNCVAPGLTDTLLMKESTKQKFINKTIENLMIKRIAEPKEIANAILFLASDLSSYITGQTIRVDGGMN